MIKTCSFLLFATLLMFVGRVHAQERLLGSEPHDLLTIPDGKDTKVLQVAPLPLANRKIPQDPKPAEKMRVRLLDDEENRDFEIMWRDIKKIELWEDRILAEAESLSASGKLDDAYANYSYLFK